MGHNLLINERYWGYNPLILKTITHKNMQEIQLLVKYDHFPIYRGEPFKKSLSWNHHLFARVIFFGWFCLLILPHTHTLLAGNGPQLTQWQRLDANRSAKQKALWYAAFWYIEIRWSRRCGSHMVFCPPLRATGFSGWKTSGASSLPPRWRLSILRYPPRYGARPSWRVEGSGVPWFQHFILEMNRLNQQWFFRCLGLTLPASNSQRLDAYIKNYTKPYLQSFLSFLGSIFSFREGKVSWHPRTLVPPHACDLNGDVERDPRINLKPEFQLMVAISDSPKKDRRLLVADIFCVYTDFIKICLQFLMAS